VDVVYLSKDNDAGTRSLHALGELMPDARVRSWLAKAGEKLPAWDDWGCDLLISYLCPRIIPSNILSASRLPINFHPAPPEYPGFGCYNFAIYEGADEYGATCHRMVAEVDSGDIYALRRFPMAADVSVATLQEATLAAMHELFVDVLRRIAGGEVLKKTEDWRRPPTSRKDFEALRQVPVDADAGEVDRRVRAFAHPDFDGAYIRLHGFDFIALPPGRTTR
jgi:methionyl-tRNA formyltransferase